MLRRTPPPPTLPFNVPDAFLSRETLLGAGLTARDITAAVRGGHLLRPRSRRARRGKTDDSVRESVAHGGRLDCVSLLALLGVFVLDHSSTHVQVDAHSTRLPNPSARVIRHWRDTDASYCAVVTPIVEALAQAVRCQTPRAAIATLDSAWHLGVVDESGLAEVFASLPRKYRLLRPLLDGRAESGTETLVRLILRTLGVRPDLQVKISGVGFVDLLVDGWLIVECDSAAHHSSWSQIKTDRRRDAAAAAQGYTTVRLLAEDILYHPEWVLGVLKGILAAHSDRTGVENSGSKRQRSAWSRAASRPPKMSPEL